MRCECEGGMCECGCECGECEGSHRIHGVSEKHLETGIIQELTTVTTPLERL